MTMLAEFALDGEWEHRAATKMVSRLQDVLRASVCHQGLASEARTKYESLRHFCVRHFNSEELLMQQSGFELSTVHQREHQKLMSWLDDHESWLDHFDTRERLSHVLQREFLRLMQDHADTFDLHLGRHLSLSGWQMGTAA